MNRKSDDEHQERHSGPLLASEPASSDGAHLSIDHDGVAVEVGAGAAELGEPLELEKEKEEPATWASLPHRSQLIILTLARLSEPLVQTSLQVRSSCIDKRLRSRMEAELSLRTGIHVLSTQILRRDPSRFRNCNTSWAASFFFHWSTVPNGYDVGENI